VVRLSMATDLEKAKKFKYSDMRAIPHKSIVMPKENNDFLQNNHSRLFTVCEAPLAASAQAQPTLTTVSRAP
jgi:hypothetical protein